MNHEQIITADIIGRSDSSLVGACETTRCRLDPTEDSYVLPIIEKKRRKLANVEVLACEKHQGDYIPMKDYEHARRMRSAKQAGPVDEGVSI